ncbi:MAG: hypothetical protein R3E01_04840 [Pirellulaceae bacterium]
MATFAATVDATGALPSTEWVLGFSTDAAQLAGQLRKDTPSLRMKARWTDRAQSSCRFDGAASQVPATGLHEGDQASCWKLVQPLRDSTVQLTAV